MRVQLTCHVFVLLGLGASAAGCSDIDDRPREAPVGRTASGVGDGTFDDGNVLSHTGALAKRGSQVLSDGTTSVVDTLYGSAFLATRRVVVTASHAVDRENTTNPVAVYFAFNPMIVDAKDSRVFLKSGNAFPRLPGINPDDDNDVAKDVGVIFLDRRVPEDVAATLRPAGLHNPDCETDLDEALLVGFGPTVFDPNIWTRQAHPEIRVRNFAGSDGWTRHTYEGGSQTFENSWPLAIDYHGTLPGDSGGPLLDSGRTHACGVSSATVKVPFLTTWNAVSKSAAVDSADNKAFLRELLLDKNGNFIGEVPGPDRDGDGTADSEDNCPDMPNPDQLDSDGDGWGDRCDNCVLVPNRRQEDSNLGAEISVHGPIPGAPPADGLVEAKWPGDACDPNPITVVDSTAGDFAPVGNVRTLDCTEHQGFFCEGPFVSDGKCELSRDNVIVTTELTRTAVTLPDGSITGSLRALTRLVACTCADGVPADVCENTTCQHGNVQSPSSAWTTMSMFDTRFPTTLLNRRSGSPIPLPTSLINTLHVPIDLYAYSRSLGWAYWNDLILPPPEYTPDPTDPTEFRVIPKTVFHGLVWSWVRTFNPNTQPYPNPTATPTGTPVDQQLRQTVTEITVHEAANKNHRQEPCEQLKYIRAIDRQDCLVCNSGVFLAVIAAQTSNPNPTFISPERSRVDADGQVGDAVVAAMRDATSKVVMASDDRAWSLGSVRGAIVSSVGAVVSPLITNSQGGIFVPRGAGLGDGGPLAALSARPRPTGKQLVAMSGHRQEIAFLERDDNGIIQRLRTFDFDLQREVMKPFLGRYRLVDPIAMTYRAEDDGYYILDRTEDSRPTLTMYRLRRGSTLEVMGRWQRRGKFTDAELTTGSDGLLVMSTWNGKEHAIAVIDPDATPNGNGQRTSGRLLRVISVTFGAGAIEVAAHRNRESLTFITRTPSGATKPVRILNSTLETKNGSDSLDVLSDTF